MFPIMPTENHVRCTVMLVPWDVFELLFDSGRQPPMYRGLISQNSHIAEGVLRFTLNGMECVELFAVEVTYL